MKLIEQNYGDSTFTDSSQLHWSVKVKPEHITVISGTATPKEIAADINHWSAKAQGKAVGWNK